MSTIGILLAILNVLRIRTKGVRRSLAGRSARKAALKRSRADLKAYAKGNLKGVKKARMDMKRLGTSMARTRKRIGLIRKIAL
jgi:hypothetical protein